MKPAKIQPVKVTPDQQLSLLTANARTVDRRVHAAEKKARLAKAKLKSARKAYKLAKKALKKVAKLTKQAHKDLAKWQKQSAEKQKRDHAKSIGKTKPASPNKRKRGPAPKPPTAVDLTPPVLFPVAPLPEKTELPKPEQDSSAVPQAAATPPAPSAGGS